MYGFHIISKYGRTEVFFSESQLLNFEDNIQLFFKFPIFNLERVYYGRDNARPFHCSPSWKERLHLLPLTSRWSQAISSRQQNMALYALAPNTQTPHTKYQVTTVMVAVITLREVGPSVVLKAGSVLG